MGKYSVELKKFISNNNRLPKSRETLGSWFTREQFRKNIISTERIKLLEEIKEWVWKVNEFIQNSQTILMATFDEFYSSLDSDPGIRGKQFEKFVKWS